MSVVCEVAVPFVATAAVEGSAVGGVLGGHSATCLKCQARYAAMSRAAKEMAVMKEGHFEAPRDLEWKVMSSLEGDLAISRSWKKPITYVAAGVSMAIALVVWRARPRTS